MKTLLRGHTDHVNAIKFFPYTENKSVIFSGSVDQTVRVWQAQSKNLAGFELVAILHSHTGSVNCFAVCKGVNLVVSGSADATVKVWCLHFAGDDLTVNLIQTVQIRPRLFPLALSLHNLNAGEGFLLAVAGTASNVQIYIASKIGTFGQQATLTGHEGWIRSLAISKETDAPNSDLILATASQDKYIRLWRIIKAKRNGPVEDDSLIEAFEKSLSNKAHKVVVSQCSYTITFEALLLGHEDWIYTIAWRLDRERLQLLSASADNSVAIWQSEERSGVWVCTARLGEISSQKGGTTATGSTGGFWIGLWSPGGENIVSLGRAGGWRLWGYDKAQTRWVQGIGVSGHTKPVTDIAWSKNGSYLLSTGSDQTTRLHAAWKYADERSWHEMSRPQIHGYNLNCIDCIDQTQFISGADEKLLRVFDEPRATAGLLDRLCGVKTNVEQSLPDAANIPVLGLSNKAIENVEDVAFPLDGNDGSEWAAKETSEAPLQTLNLEHPPFEDQLARHTLWPEKEKLYGHGYEISAVAASHDGTLVATSCRASSLEHSVVRLYRTQDWHEVKPPLTAHSLTVTALRFANDDQYLLSVGRDRQWAVFERDTKSPDKYNLKHSNPKGHSRMILNAGWAPLTAGRIFATAGRDKVMRMWKVNEKSFECMATITLNSPVTAVDICPLMFQEDLVIASGTEMGEVVVHIIRTSNWTIRYSSELEES